MKSSVLALLETFDGPPAGELWLAWRDVVVVALLVEFDGLLVDEGWLEWRDAIVVA